MIPTHLPVDAFRCTPIAFLCVLICPFIAAAAGAYAAEVDGREYDRSGLRTTPTCKWLPEPYPVPNAKATSEAEMKRYREVIPGTDVTFEMVPIPAGTFLMGSPEGELGRRPDEGPQHRVEIDAFWMGQHEVTWDEFLIWDLGIDKCRRLIEKREPTKWDELGDAIGQPDSAPQDVTFGMGVGRRPAICMTQLAAKVYCKWLSAKTGRYYRLPTEAEWEYACRAGTTTAYSFGEAPGNLGKYAVYFENSDDQTHEVASKRPNPWGLHDMHGNVAEWVLDQYLPDYYQQAPAAALSNPVAVPRAIYPRVFRGGSWDDDPEDLRSAARRASSPDLKRDDSWIPKNWSWYTRAIFLGFRVVRPLRIPSAEEAHRYEPTHREMKMYFREGRNPDEDVLPGSQKPSAQEN